MATKTAGTHPTGMLFCTAIVFTMLPEFRASGILYCDFKVPLCWKFFHTKNGPEDSSVEGTIAIKSKVRCQ